MSYDGGHLAWVMGAVLLLLWTLWRTVEDVVWKPYAIMKQFERQGVRGPGYNLLWGSVKDIRAIKFKAGGIFMPVGCHDITFRVLPHYHLWASLHGKTFLYWLGTNPRVCIRDPEQVRQVLSNKMAYYVKPYPGANIMALLGKGLAFAEGSDWAKHRRIVSPAFTLDKLKVMTERMADCTLAVIGGWEPEAGESKEIEISQQLLELTANVISHTVFGSSFADGKDLFLAQKELQQMAIASLLGLHIPGSQYLPTKENLRKWMLEKRMKRAIMRIIRTRLDDKDSGYGQDVLGLMLEASMNDVEEKKAGLNLSIDEIIDECKTFFFSGHETTSHLLTWTIFLLSTNRDWQERLREEVQKECQMEIPTADILGKLKLMTMVLMETLRLYCPVISLARKATQDMRLGDLMIPRGTTVTMPIAMIHRDKEYWGANAEQFNPLRFENGASKAAKHPNAMMPFAVGPRACVGQNFAMLEAKMVMAMILQRFSFWLSPKYKHAPASLLTLQPQFGLPIIFRPLCAPVNTVE